MDPHNKAQIAAVEKEKSKLEAKQAMAVPQQPEDLEEAAAAPTTPEKI